MISQIRSFLMQPVSYNPAKHRIQGYYVSGKISGIRCLWDGGISRDVVAEQVPWSNSTGLKATGLWTQHAHVVTCPPRWLNNLPSLLVDGVLISTEQHLTYQTMDTWDWTKIDLAVISMPAFTSIFKDGVIVEGTFQREIKYANVMQWIQFQPKALYNDFFAAHPATIFEVELFNLNEWLTWDTVYLHPHIKLPEVSDSVARQSLRQLLSKYPNGIFLRNPDALWEPTYSQNMLRISPCDYHLI